MPRYFFNVRDGIPIIKDHVGIELPDLAAAIDVGHKEAAMVVTALMAQPTLLKDLKIHICSAEGEIMEQIDLPDISEFAM